MRHTDAQLIQRTLSGDETAFASLVGRYEKRVHAFVLRKVGNFQDAEEVTQDVFLRAYDNLSKLRNPDRFVGWLYVIATRVCVNWLRKQKPVMRSLEGMSVKERETLSYSRYVSEQHQMETSEALGDAVEKILKRLPKHERKVVRLYYLGGLRVVEIGRILDVPVNTIKSRLRRARRRLQEKSGVCWNREGSQHANRRFEL